MNDSRLSVIYQYKVLRSYQNIGTDVFEKSFYGEINVCTASYSVGIF